MSGNGDQKRRSASRGENVASKRGNAASPGNSADDEMPRGDMILPEGQGSEMPRGEMNSAAPRENVEMPMGAMTTARTQAEMPAGLMTAGTPKSRGGGARRAVSYTPGPGHGADNAMEEPRPEPRGE